MKGLTIQVTTDDRVWAPREAIGLQAHAIIRHGMKIEHAFASSVQHLAVEHTKAHRRRGKGGHFK